MESENLKKPVLTIVTPTMSVDDTFNSLLKNFKKQGIEVKPSSNLEMSRQIKNELSGKPEQKTKE